ncbi:Ankyrin repeat domain-containing protein 27 [Eumeta japonica]|uniref:Ankyrin repeat domain-containing protein 27 n=1 Tax=Eumeta variegata TaxID=151549 RepID=A0A4C1XQE0_EUMVA|nr:Ankyrin repeat domain-containing protein 27 [Eumeta japonica]
MDDNYDENLSENPFFVELTNEFASLYQHCISESWIICVPRVGSLTTRVFTVEDFCAHILVPNEELPETHYSTLTEKQVTVVNKVITVELTKGLPLQSHILFEETFYTDDLIKYKVWCIEIPLEPTPIRSGNAISKEYLASINDCIDFLWTQSAGRQVLDLIEQSVKIFKKKNNTLPTAIAPLRDAVSELYTQCLQITLQNRRLREKSKACKQILENIKLAVECYMQHLLYDTIFKPICTCASYEDSHLNKAIRNLSDIQLRDLDIKKDLYHAVPKAKQLLSEINNYNTVLEKVVCIKKALNTINKYDNKDNLIILTADDMLPIFVFLIIKSNLPNWYSQLTYMKEFRFSGVSKGDGDECAFLITTLEAVIQHIQSGALVGPPNPESYYYESDLTEDNLQEAKRKNSIAESLSTSESNVGEETLEHVFDLIRASHIDQLRTILERNQKNITLIQENSEMFDLLLDNDNFIDNYDSETGTDLCHPLCNCVKCHRTISRNLLKTSPTVMSRDGHGLTPLHTACIHGKASVVELLLEMGAEIDATDLNENTPLHHAASKGHQNALLLLLHSGANISCKNIDKNTPLHLSVNNGHISCVKALIYFSESSKHQLNVNCRNENGDTPLHLASKWGYEGISKLLIENGAEPSFQNKKLKTAFDYAHNLRILQVLKSCTPSLYEYIHISSSEFKELNCKSDRFVKAKLQAIRNKELNNCNIPKSLENLKQVERVLKAITYGDVKLACFYMNINYSAYAHKNNVSKMSPRVCHPLCECQLCKRKSDTCSLEFDVNSCDTNGHTALHFAAQYGLDVLCDILILNKANIECINKNGETPLHMAATKNQIKVLRVLIEYGANINAVDVVGNTALHNASQMGNIGAVKIILSYNPNISILNGSEKSALDIAKSKVYLTIIDLMEKYIDKNSIND